MVFVALILGFIVSKKFGDLDLNNLKIEHMGLLGLGILIDLFLMLATSINLGNITNFFIKYYSIFHVIYLFIFAVTLILNKKNFGLQLMGIGFLLNMIPILLNGKMPVADSLLHNISIRRAEIIKMGKSLSHGVFVDPRAEILSDIVYLPFPYKTLISVGDILIAIGIFLAIIIHSGVIEQARRKL